MATNNTFWAKLQAFRSKHTIISGLILMAIVGMIAIWACLIFLNFWTHHGDNATVPQIKNMSYAEAQRKLEEHNLSIEISDSIYDTTIPAGTVVESWPKAGSVVKNGRNVYVTVTAFSPKQVTISMPITGVSVRQAMSYLNALGINSLRFVNVPSEYPDLVESAHADNRPIGVGSVLPVDATVILEVGVAMAPAIEESTDSISTETAIEEDLSSLSSYEE